jgi:hypothetical protein
MALEREELPYRTEARQESLGALRHLEAAHAALAFTRGLMAVFRTVVEPGTGFDEDVLDVCQFGDLSLCRRIATQLVGHDLAWHIGRRGKHALEKALGCSLIATLLQQDIEFGAVLIDCSPQQIRLAAQRHKHLVQMPCGAGLATRSFHAMREARAEEVWSELVYAGEAEF